MNDILEFSDVLRLIDERSTVLRAAIAAGIDVDAAVPTHPDWRLFDLVQHLSVRRRTWAATVATGPAATKWSPWSGESAAPGDGEAPLAWSAEATRQLGRFRRLNRTADAGHRGRRRSHRGPDVPWPGMTYRKSRSMPMARSSLSMRRKVCR